MSVPRHAYVVERIPSLVREDWSTANPLAGEGLSYSIVLASQHSRVEVVVLHLIV